MCNELSNLTVAVGCKGSHEDKEVEKSRSR